MGQDWAGASVSLCNYSSFLEINQKRGHLPAGPKSEVATLPFTAWLSPPHLHLQGKECTKTALRASTMVLKAEAQLLQP